jgi:hypothetical protein
MAIPDLNTLRNTFTCPLSYEMFQDPVTEAKGTCNHTFERRWIEEWLVDNQTCPLSREQLRSYQLVANDRIKRACELLDPNRADPLTPDDIRLLNGAASDINERAPAQAALGVHEFIMARVAVDGVKDQCKNAYGC